MGQSTDSLGKRIAKGASWSIFSRLIVRCLGFISTLILARILVPDDFGLILIAYTCVGIFEVMGEFGLDTILITEQKSSRTLYNTAWSLQVLRGLVIACILFFGASGLASIFGDERLEPILYWLSLGALVQGLFNIGIVDFRKELQLHKELQFQVFRKVVSFVVTIALALYWKNYWALVAGILAGHICGLILSYSMSNYRPAWNLSEWSRVLHFSKWLLYINILNYASAKGDNLIIGSNIGAGELGYYGMANEVASLPTNELVFPIQRAVFPGFSKISHNLEELRSTYLSAFSLICLIAMPMGFGIALVAQPIVHVLLGEKWIPAIPLIEILAVAGALRVAGASAGSVFYALKKVKLVSAIGTFNTLLRLGLLFWLVSKAGVEGAAWAIFVSTIISLILTLTVLAKILQFDFYRGLSNIIRIGLAIAFMCWAVTGLDSLALLQSLFEQSHVAELVFKVTAGLISYVVTLILLWILWRKPEGPEKIILQFIKPKLPVLFNRATQK